MPSNDSIYLFKNKKKKELYFRKKILPIITAKPRHSYT